MFTCCGGTGKSVNLPELMYFDFAGRGEPIRLMLVASDQKFTDTRIKFEDWPKMKPKTPNGTIPIFTVDGKKLCQASAIQTYAGMQGKLIPKDGMGFARNLEVFGQIGNLYDRIGAFAMAPDSSKDEMGKVLVDYAKLWFPAMEKIAASNGTEGCVWGKDMTAADIAITCVMRLLKLGQIAGVAAGIADSVPRLEKIHKKVMGYSKIKEYYENLHTEIATN